MKKSFLFHIVLFPAAIIGLAFLFSLPYHSVKEKTIAAFNNEQLLLAGQASQGISGTFAMFERDLRYFTGEPAVITMNDAGRDMLRDFLAAHSSDLLAILRLDRDGGVLFRVARPEALPEELPANVLARLPSSPSTAVHNIFLRNTILALLFSPIDDGGTPAGGLAFILSFEELVDRFIQPLKADRNRRTWVINGDGIVLHCPDPAHFGTHISETAQAVDGSSLPTIMREMARGEKGAGSFIFRDLPGNDTPREINHVVFMPIRLPGNNHWSIAAAAPETAVLANMNHFRNNWLQAMSVTLLTLLGLGFFLIRSQAMAREEKKQQRYEEQMVELMDFTPIGIIVYDIRGALLYANNAAREMWRQHSPARLEGMNIFDIIHPDYRGFARQRFWEALRGHSSEPYVLRISLPGGEMRSMEIHTSSLDFSGQRCGVSVLQDVSRRLRIEEEQQRLATAMANTQDAIVITDRNGTIEYVNPAFSRITGYSREEAMGRNPRMLKSGRQDRPFYEHMWQTLLQGMVWEGRLINRRKDGSFYTERASISPVRDKSGEITHFVAVKRDISHEVELESHLHQAHKMEAIGTLAGGIAHDFNNILGAIIGYTELSLLQTPSGSPVREHLHHIRNSGKRAADLIQQILTFSRQSAQRGKIPVNIVPLLKETLKMLRASIPTTIDMRLEIAEPEGWISADPVQVQQVIMNLCTNAFHAMSDKGGTLTVGLRRKAMTGGPGEAGGNFSCLELQVADTGHGIDRAIMGRIFDPFFTTKEPGVGTGLGLSVVHGIIQDLGGTIGVDSDAGGTTFTVTIPETGRPAVEEQPRNGKPPHGSESILFVDDEEDIRKTYRMMLEQLGYRVTACETPLEALSLVGDSTRCFDLVISDQNMPRMTGTELLGEIRRRRPDLPVILCTGFSEQLTEETARRAGASQLLLKPIDYRVLAETIHRTLHGGGQAPPG
ncbi:MAG: PAS domain S-box protein [Desulfobulbaceae bacterium]|jgi:PAS domain S-box-containing protein|nr:PAS domain S-box protein [Desulfobulbaceae bacterium]MDY0351974.1 PAS domain S-box protein [Desulfobulbaceae bacterium]